MAFSKLRNVFYFLDISEFSFLDFCRYFKSYQLSAKAPFQALQDRISENLFKPLVSYPKHVQRQIS